MHNNIEYIIIYTCIYISDIYNFLALKQNPKNVRKDEK